MDKSTPRPWKTEIPYNKELMAQIYQDGKSELHVLQCHPEDAELIVRAVNSHEALLEACKKAQAVCLDSIVGKAIKAGVLEESEQHAGLCLVGFIMKEIGQTLEKTIQQAEAKS